MAYGICFFSIFFVISLAGCKNPSTLSKQKSEDDSAKPGNDAPKTDSVKGVQLILDNSNLETNKDSLLKTIVSEKALRVKKIQDQIKQEEMDQNIFHIDVTSQDIQQATVLTDQTKELIQELLINPNSEHNITSLGTVIRFLLKTPVKNDLTKDLMLEILKRKKNAIYLDTLFLVLAKHNVVDKYVASILDKLIRYSSFLDEFVFALVTMKPSEVIISNSTQMIALRIALVDWYLNAEFITEELAEKQCTLTGNIYPPTIAAKFISEVLDNWPSEKKTTDYILHGEHLKGTSLLDIAIEYDASVQRL